jgi:hypothetical protein
MKIHSIIKEDGVIVKGVNTTVDVQPGETERQAKKYFGGNGTPIELDRSTQKLFNLGLVNESQQLTWEKVVKQSDPIKVLDMVSTRKDNTQFPVRMYDGSTIGVTPTIAKKIIDVYLDVDDEKKKKIQWFLRTKNGFKELAQLVGNAMSSATARADTLKDSVVEHIDEFVARQK